MCEPKDVAHGCSGSSCNACPAGGANQTAACDNSGNCTLQCNPGFAHCTNNPNDGCETATSDDVDNCGGCGKKCGTAHATASCSGGTCSLVCAQGFIDCNGTNSDGCEADISKDPNCGGCSNDCTKIGGQTCKPYQLDQNPATFYACQCGSGSDCGGQNGVACSTMYGDCICPGSFCAYNEVCVPNPAPAPGTSCSCNGGAGCAITDVCCPKGCANITGTDNNNCGACGNVCPTGKSCVAGTCM
jgi:hypothetical protein